MPKHGIEVDPVSSVEQKFTQDSHIHIPLSARHWQR
jgi:hypothetical protein